MFDKLLELRSSSAAAIDETTTETGISHPVRAAGQFKIVFHVTDLDTEDENETYTLSVLVSDTVANLTVSPVEVASTPIEAVGVYEVLVSSAHIGERDTDGNAITVRATLGGTSPSLTYGAWIEPIR